METKAIFEIVGKYKFDISSAKNDDGNFDGDKLDAVYCKIGLKICEEETLPSKERRREYFNFLCNISGLKGIKIAEYLKVDRGMISQWRRNPEKGISDLSWHYIRLFFQDFLKNDFQVTNPIFSQSSDKQDENVQLVIIS